MKHFLWTASSFLTYIPLVRQETKLSFSVFGVITNRNFSFGLVIFLVILSIFYVILFLPYFMISFRFILISKIYKTKNNCYINLYIKFSIFQHPFSYILTYIQKKNVDMDTKTWMIWIWTTKLRQNLDKWIVDGIILLLQEIWISKKMNCRQCNFVDVDETTRACHFLLHNEARTCSLSRRPLHTGARTCLRGAGTFVDLVQWWLRRDDGHEIKEKDSDSWRRGLKWIWVKHDKELQPEKSRKRWN